MKKWKKLKAKADMGTYGGPNTLKKTKLGDVRLGE